MLKDKSDQIIWGEDFHETNIPIPHKNGFKRRLFINILNPNDAGKSLTVKVCRNIAADIQSGSLSKVTIQEVDDRLRKLFFDLPDPDLALYFGGICSTFGLSPWHFRLTEFINANSLKALTSKTFVYALYRYSKCEQRFGK